MINFGKILRQSWHILWSYRILWLFGLLLALTTGLTSNPGNSSRYQFSQSNFNIYPGLTSANTPQFIQQFGQWFNQNVEPLVTQPLQHMATIWTIVGILLLIILLVGLIFAFVRYPSETAVIRMVDEYEHSGSKLSFRSGWKLGWTRRAFRLWLVDLVLAIPALLFVLLIAAAGWIALSSYSPTLQATNVLGMAAAVGLGSLGIFFLIVVVVFLTLLRNLFARAIALDGLGVGASLKTGWGMFKRNWKSAGLMWLVMVGIGIVFGILGLIVFFLLIPAYLVMLLPAVVAAIIPALIALGITSIFASGPLAWFIALLTAIPFFFVILFAPLLFFNGFYEVFSSSIWTLTYREIKALENLSVPPSPIDAIPDRDL